MTPVARRALLTIVLFGLARPSLAQPVSTGVIEGSVTGITGMALPGVTVAVVDPMTGQSRTAVTGDDGRYAIAVGQPGTYVVQASVEGFNTATQSGVDLQLNERETVNFLLLPSTTESLEVTGRLPVDEVPAARNGQVISERLAHSVPLIGRDFIALATLTPGFTGNPIAPSPNGQIYWTNNIVVDGASHFSKWRAAARTFNSGYSLESIQDVRVLTNSFAPEFGEALAAVTTAVTRSGTNERHGSVFLFGQNGALNDQPVFASQKPSSSSLRGGFSAGGPIAIDRTFYYASYEGHRARAQNFTVSPASAVPAVPRDSDENTAFVKVDHRVSTNEIVTMRYNRNWLRWHNENGGIWLPGSGTDFTNDSHTALLTASLLLGQHTVNQARFQFAQYVDQRTDLNPALYVSRAGYSIEGGILGPFGFGVSPENTYEGSDIITHTAGNHSVKLGAGFRFVSARSEALPYGNGAYFFDGPPAQFPAPSLFMQAFSPTSTGTTVDSRSVASYGFVQDEWRAGTRLSANIGVRYDIEQIRGVKGYDAVSDTNNLQPRASVSWMPFGSRVTLHGGAGIYTQQHLLYYVNRVQLEGASGSALIALTPASARMPVFPAVLTPDVLTAVPRDVYVVDRDFHNPYSVQLAAGATIQALGFTFTADYVRLAGRDLMSVVDANAPASIDKPNARTVAQADGTRPLAPTPGGYRKIITLGNEGRSWYRALQTKAERTVASFQLVAAYTLARARDRANYQLPEDSRRLDAEEGRADNDIRHNVAAALTWQLPFTSRLAGGWTLSAAGQFRSNRPYNIWFGYDRNGTTQIDARPGRRNTGKTDIYRAIDLALSRRLPIGTKTIEVRAEVFNVLSTVNYDEYMGALSSPLFSAPMSAFPKRQLQFAARFRF